MRALRFDKFGDPSVLTLADIPPPALLPGEALVRVHASGINPSDVKNVAGAMSQTRPPRTPGRDYAGVVVDGPDEWIGKAVWGSSGRLGFVADGAHAEFVAVPADSLCEKPASLTMEQAASIGVPFITAYESLVNRAALKAGETFLIVGGTGAVGAAASKIARWSVCRVIATVRSDDVDPELAEVVDVFVNLKREDLAEAVKASTGGRGVDAALNVVGGETIRPTLASLSRKGRLSVIAATLGREVTIDLLSFYRNELTLHGVDSLKLTDSQSSAILSDLAPGFATGALTASPIEVTPLADASQAYARVAAGARTKIVLTMGG